MIEIENAQFTTTHFSRKLTKKELKRLAGDIKNWLFTRKSVYCDIWVKDE